MARPADRAATRRAAGNTGVRFESGEPVSFTVHDQDWHVLLGVATNFAWRRTGLYHCRVTCDGPRLGVAGMGSRSLEVEDGVYKPRTSRPAHRGAFAFHGRQVLAEPAESERVAVERNRIEERADRDAKATPPAKLIHTATLPGKPARVIGVHDLNDDGRFGDRRLLLRGDRLRKGRFPTVRVRLGGETPLVDGAIGPGSILAVASFVAQRGGYRR